MGCYRVWKNGQYQDFHHVRLGVETVASTLCVRRDEPAPPAGEIRKLEGFLDGIEGFARLEAHTCERPASYLRELCALLNNPDNGPHTI